MNNMENFKNSLLLNKNDDNETKYEELKKERDILLSPKYQDFSNLILVTIGKEIEEQFPGVKFRLLCRTKSYDSFEKKAKKKIKQKSKLYDNIGYEIFIEEIPDDFETDDIEFNNKLKMLLKDRANFKNILTKAQLEHDDLIQQGKTPDYISRMQDDIFRSTYEKLVEYSNNLVKTAEENLAKRNGDCGLELANHIITYLCKHSKVLKKLGISPIAGREKEHTKRYTAYQSYHNTIQVKNRNLNVEHWIAELQATSSYSYDQAEERTCSSY